MKVEVFPFADAVADRAMLRDRGVVVVDVLRASSTIVTAIVNGCREVIAVEDANEAVRMTRTLDHALLCGERGGVKINGFHLGNSPTEYAAHIVGGRTLILSTTNGTRAVMKARESRNLYIGALLNARAVARALVASGDACAILCAGTMGRFSLDDILCAGAIIDRIGEQVKITEIDDLGIAALGFYRNAQADIASTLLGAAHALYLAGIGMRDDVLYCAQEDIFDAVPLFRDGMIRDYRA